MGISFERTAVAGGFPVFWRGEFKVLPGDFKIKQTFPEGTLIPKGTPIMLDFDNMECGVCKVAKRLATGTTTIPHVTKGTLLQVGDVVALVGATDLSRTITAIDRTNDGYDVITLDGALTGFTEGNFMIEAEAYVADPENLADPLYLPDAVTVENSEYKADSFTTLAAGYDGVVLKEVAYPIPASWLTGFSLTKNPSIKYIKQ
nr:hypothetical protein [uncultured Draconibacterium sp.]